MEEEEEIVTAVMTLSLFVTAFFLVILIRKYFHLISDAFWTFAIWVACKLMFTLVYTTYTHSLAAKLVFKYLRMFWWIYGSATEYYESWFGS